MNKKIIIDAGHGGSDSGAVANNIIEKDLTLKIAKYIKKRLDDLNIESTLVRDDDSTLSPKDRVNKILNTYGNSNDVILLSNHINAGGGDGAEVIYALRNNDTLSKLILSELARAGQNSRRVYQKTLPTDSSKDYYYILRDTPNIESLIIEYGFLDSKNSDEISMLKNNYEELAEAVVKALTTYLQIPYNINSVYYYNVVKGDTLWSIARKFNISVDKLKDINNLKDNTISIGQKLLVSDNIKNDNIYIVKKGDTLYSIAKKFNVAVEDLKQINNLVSDILSIGQELLVSDNNLKYSNIYDVVKGDTLYSIAKKFNTTVSNLIELNNLESTVLSIGQKLLIP